MLYILSAILLRFICILTLSLSLYTSLNKAKARHGKANKRKQIQEILILRVKKFLTYISYQKSIKSSFIVSCVSALTVSVCVLVSSLWFCFYTLIYCCLTLSVTLEIKFKMFETLCWCPHILCLKELRLIRQSWH